MLKYDYRITLSYLEICHLHVEKHESENCTCVCVCVSECDLFPQRQLSTGTRSLDDIFQARSGRFPVATYTLSIATFVYN